MDQHIRFCTAPDGVRIAFAEHGHGSPIVRPATWLTHLEFDWDSPVWRHWLHELGRTNTVVRYDERGCGLSDRDVGELSLDAWVGDLEAVCDAAGLERFTLLGISHGGPVAVAYAARHPERVRRLVLYGTYARGRYRRPLTAEQREEADVLLSLARVAWGRADPVFRRVFTSLFIPGATEEQMQWFDELQRASSSGEMAAQLRLARGQLDVTHLSAAITAPTTVLHARDDAVVPFEEGRHLASLVPGARFVPLDGRNHILLEDEPAWQAFLREVRGVLGVQPNATERASLTHLSERELHVLSLVAEGLGNAEIASRLDLSARTIERHLSNIYVKLGLSGRGARAAAVAYLSRIRPRA
jgi:pimeloyl-ACP methyl ester carboxylesterase/DNA-binding CsgD family transcriptional regulator